MVEAVTVFTARIRRFGEESKPDANVIWLPAPPAPEAGARDVRRGRPCKSARTGVQMHRRPRFNHQFRALMRTILAIAALVVLAFSARSRPPRRTRPSTGSRQQQFAQILTQGGFKSEVVASGNDKLVRVVAAEVQVQRQRRVLQLQRARLHELPDRRLGHQQDAEHRVCQRLERAIAFHQGLYRRRGRLRLHVRHRHVGRHLAERDQAERRPVRRAADRALAVQSEIGGRYANGRGACGSRSASASRRFSKRRISIGMPTTVAIATRVRTMAAGDAIAAKASPNA